MDKFLNKKKFQRYTGLSTDIQCPKSLTGFTLIEGIIAIAIISTALIVGLSLAYSNLIAAQNNSDRIIAANLAQEGIEVMRNIRDSNWLRREANFDKDNNPANGTQFYAWDDFFNGWPEFTAACDPQFGCGNFFDIQLVSNTFSTGLYPYTLVQVAQALTIKDIFGCLDGSQPTCKVRKDNSVYYQTVSAEHETSFYRRIELWPICYKADPPPGILLVDDEPKNDQSNMNCGIENSIDKGDKVGVLVISNVIWRRGAKILEVQLKERLYNWQNL